MQKTYLKLTTTMLTLMVISSAEATAAQANMAGYEQCELLVVQSLAHQLGRGAQLVSYIPAQDFLHRLQKDGTQVERDIDGQPIRGVLCQRNDILPTQDDYAILATGIPLILSQDFDSTETDSLTLLWKDEVLKPIYKGYPLSQESQDILSARLKDFNSRKRN